MSSKAHAQGGAKRSVKERLIEEFKRFLVMFVYLWVLFGLFALHEKIVLRESGLDFTRQGFALINALVLAKVMLIAEGLGLGRHLTSRALIYPILLQSFAFTVVFILFHVLESVVVGMIHGETAAASVPLIGGGGFVGLLCVAVIFFFALMPFFAFREVSRKLEPGRLNALLFGRGGS